MLYLAVEKMTQIFGFDFDYSFGFHLEVENMVEEVLVAMTTTISRL